MRFHILGLPHTISTPEYSACAFTQKVVKLCKMLTAEGHHVIHYGHESSKVDCAEHVTVTTAKDLKDSYGDHNWRKLGFPAFSRSDPAYQMFYAKAHLALLEKKLPNDFLLCAFGDWHRPFAELHPDMIAVESGIGYPNGVFARYRIYESYAIMHGYQTNQAAVSPANDRWYDAVIPNAFNLDEFEYSPTKQDYFLFLGRVNEGKGFHIASQIAEETKTKLIVAGATNGVPTFNPYVEYVGVASPKQRAALLRDAKATICASTYLEPFCGVQIESFISGTPVISSDWGAFGEYNRHGKTGYRCKTFEQFLWAARHVGDLDPAECRAWGSEFSLEKIAPHYTDYFRSVLDIRRGKGWYEPREDRTSLETASFGSKVQR
jgi:glycosyltransferase involved in cell wall biosynthesis